MGCLEDRTEGDVLILTIVSTVFNFKSSSYRFSEEAVELATGVFSDHVVKQKTNRSRLTRISTTMFSWDS